MSSLPSSARQTKHSAGQLRTTDWHQQYRGLFNQPLETRPVNEAQWHYVIDFYGHCPGFCVLSSCHCCIVLLESSGSCRTPRQEMEPSEPRNLSIMVWSLFVLIPALCHSCSSNTGNENTSCWVSSPQLFPFFASSSVNGYNLYTLYLSWRDELDWRIERTVWKLKSFIYLESKSG